MPERTGLCIRWESRRPGIPVLAWMCQNDPSRAMEAAASGRSENTQNAASALSAEIERGLHSVTWIVSTSGTRSCRIRAAGSSAAHAGVRALISQFWR